MIKNITLILLFIALPAMLHAAGASFSGGATNIAIGSAPVADFTVDDTDITEGGTVNFTDLSTESPTSWAWDIDNDGDTDYTTQSPSHEYTTAGTYTVSLTAKNAWGISTETKTDYISVSAAGHTDYSALASCMGYWRMNGTTTETDRTSNGNDLSLSSGDTIPTSSDVPSGFSGTSRDFELGDAEWLSIADGTELDIYGADQQITVVAWIKSETTNYAASAHVAGKYQVASDQRQYRLYVTADDVAGCNIAPVTSGASGGVENAYGTTDITPSTPAWFHIALVYDDTNLIVYVNGDAEFTEPATTGIFNGSGPFSIGGGAGDANYFFDGLIDEVAVFNTALSEAQIGEIMTYGVDGQAGGND